LQWNGCSLLELLAGRSLARLNKEPIAVQDLSAGGWREHAFKTNENWPAVNTQFERSKYLHEMDDGTRWLWKFAGFSTLDLPKRDVPTHRSVTQVLPLDHFHGFSAVPWIEGERLRQSDLDTPLAGALADYVISSAGPAMAKEETVAALERLTEMLFFNTKTLLGESAAERASKLSELIRCSATEPRPTYGDGRLQPHEFIRQRDGKVFKVDWYGHNCDHTMIGRQSWLWDCAGFLVEWQPHQHLREEILQRFYARHPFEHEALRFHCAAYSAFRAGMMYFSGPASSPAEQLRIDRATEYYSSSLSYWLDEQAPCSSVPDVSAPALEDR
jgi:hypothetical protein